jgi:hypothetical protein
MALVFWTGVADAATRKVCYRVMLADDREECAKSSETGARRPCKKGGYVDAVGHYIQLWDKDSGSSSNDEFIAKVVISGGGRRCFTFEWENAPYSGGEANPDVYLRYINRVRNIRSSPAHRVRAQDADGNDHVVTTWRNWVAKNCRRGRTCQISPVLVPTNDTSSERGLWVMALDSAQHALQVFGTIMDTDIKMRFPVDIPHSVAKNRERIDIRPARGNNGFTVAHEVGHVVMEQEFNEDDIVNGNGPTSQGWANYVAAVSWYDPDNSGTRPNLNRISHLERAKPREDECSDNAETYHAVAKAFWDLNDRNNEAGVSPASGDDDKLRFKSTRIAKGWRRFPNGTGNRQDQEAGDGANMRDYYVNNRGRFGSSNAEFFETLIKHNCLQAQSDD